MQNKTLILDGRQIEKLISMRKAIAITESAFRAHGLGKVQMPAKIYLHLSKFNGDFRAMPAYLDGMKACGIKWVNVHPDNRKYGLPSVMALIILNDVRTGIPLAVMDGTHITNMRTGASGGVAAKYLAKRNSSRVGLVGCGVQALFQLNALDEIFDLKEVAIFDKDQNRMKRFAAMVKGAKLRIVKCSSVAECVKDRDIVVTTTPSRKPIVRPEWISPGTHINAIGADAKGKVELYPGLLNKSAIFVDDRTQAIHSGEINVPMSKGLIKASDIRSTLGEVIALKKRARRSADEITIFDSTGLAIHDVALANHIYEKSNVNRGRGFYSIRF